MRMLIASDIHGDLESLRLIHNKALEFEPDMLLLLGDLVYHGPRNPLPDNYDTAGILDEMPSLGTLHCPVQCVRGNCDAEVDVSLMPFEMPDSTWISADGLAILACHGHRLPAKPPLNGIAPGTVVLRGHTHVPRAETLGGIHFWNPGSISLPKDDWPRSFGLYENGVFQVLDLTGRQLLNHRPEHA